MKDLINDITKALKTSQDFIPTLLSSKSIWRSDYPIAVIHSIKRAKTSSTKKQFKDLVDKDGITSETYTDGLFSDIYNNAPEALQCANFLALKHEAKSQVHYRSKYENDFWKKIKDVEHIDASFDFINFDENDDNAMIEFKLREIIRKRKEVHALKEVGFIWMAISSNDASEVFKHYFNENYLLVNEKYHIGWSNKLKEINMRHFVYMPESKSSKT